MVSRHCLAWNISHVSGRFPRDTEETLTFGGLGSKLTLSLLSVSWPNEVTGHPRLKELWSILPLFIRDIVWGTHSKMCKTLCHRRSTKVFFRSIFFQLYLKVRIYAWVSFSLHPPRWLLKLQSSCKLSRRSSGREEGKIELVLAFCLILVGFS